MFTAFGLTGVVELIPPLPSASAFQQRKTVLQTDDRLSDALSFARTEVEN